MYTIQFEQVTSLWPMVYLVALESSLVLWVVLSGIGYIWNAWKPYSQSEMTCQTRIRCLTLGV